MPRSPFPPLLLLIVLALSATALVSCSSSESASSDDGPLIITKRAERDTLREELTIRGTLERIEQQTVNLPTGGNFNVVNIQDGDIVNAGDVLYSIGGRPTVAVDGATPFFRSLDVGSRGPDVLQLERILSVAGHDPGVVDDLFTTQTRAALAEWQLAAGYPASSPEAGEVVTVSLSNNPSGYTIGSQNTASVTIDAARDDSALPSSIGAGASGPGSLTVPMAAALQALPLITIQSNAAVIEEGESAPFVLVSSVAPSADITIDLSFSGTATLGLDYNSPPNQQVVFPAGSTSLPLDLNTIEDLSVEPAETIDVTVLPGIGYAANSTASTTILDDDVTQLTITSSAPVREGQTGTFTIMASDPPLIDLDIPLNGPGIAVAVAPTESDATAGADFEALPASVLLRAGQTSVAVPVVTLTDDVVEADENVELSIGAGADYSIGGTGTANLVITDATANQVPIITITADANTVTEGANANFTVAASVATSRDIDLEFVFGGTAIDDTDVNFPDDLVLPAGATETTITVPTIQDDDLEPDKTITVQVAPGAEYTVGTPSYAEVVLESQDVPEISLRADPLSVAEGGVASFVLQADAPAFNEITIDYLVSGRATDSIDYEPIPAFVVLPVGQTSVSVPVQSVADTIFELDEDVVMRLEPANGYNLGDRRSATITITDAGGDPTKPTTGGPVLSVTSSAAVTAEGQSVTFTIGASAASTRDLDIEISLGGTAENSIDYTFPANDLVLPAGQTQLELRVQTRQDSLVEPPKTITVELRDGPGYSLTAPAVASTTIESEDLPELTLRGGNIALGEGDSAAFIIEADGPVAQNTSINYQIGGSATPGTDFEPLTGTIIMLAGQSSVNVPLFTLNDDIVFQPTDMLVADWPSRVGTVFVKEGQSAPEGTPVIEITEDDFTVSIAVSAADRAELTVGMQVEVEIDASDVDTVGTITELDQNATVDDAGNERYEGRVDIDTGFDAVDGSIATITVAINEAVDVIVVPIAAVLQGPDGDEVRIIDPDTGAVRRSLVEIGLDEGSFIEITSGVDEGEIVIVEVEG